MNRISNEAVVPPALVSPSGQRVHPRVTVPLGVEIAGVRYEAADWGLGGFGLTEEGPSGALDDIFKCRLIFVFPNLETSVTLSAKAVRVEDGRVRGFQFVDLSADRAEVLAYVIDRHLSGDLVALPGMLEQGEPGRIAFSEPTVRRMRTFATASRLGAIFIGVVLVAGVAGVSLVSSVLTVRSEYASVASGRTLARAPEAGYVLGAGLAPGARVARGDVLFEIQPPAKPQDLSTLENDVAMAESGVALRTQQLGEVEAAFASWTERLGVDVGASERRVKLVGAEVEARRRLFQRLSGLAASGLVSASRSDEAEVALRNAEVTLAAEEADLARLRLELKVAAEGLYLGDTRATRRTPGDARRDLAESRAELDNRRAALAAQQERFVVRSPCDCVVEGRSAKPGEYAERGATIYTLADGGEHGGEVDALVPVDRIGLLHVGAETRVLLSDRSGDVVGRVTEITYNPRNTGRTGLPDQLRALGRFALVTVALPEGTQPMSGVPATVTARVSAGDLLFRFTGIDWFVPGASS